MGTAGTPFDFAKIVHESDTYGDAHRGLLKILIDRGSITEKAFCAHFVRCFATQHYLDEIDYDRNELKLDGVTPESVDKLLKKLITSMNTKVQLIGLRLMRMHDEVKNKQMIVLVSERHYSPALAGASPFDSHNELFLVISWLEEMLKPDNDGYIPSSEALRSARNLPVPMKMEKAQQLIDQLIKDGWVRIEGGDVLTLTTRALTELGPILRSRFHCATCRLCSNVTIRKASMLTCEQCDCLIHVSCWNSLAATTNTDTVKCPGYNCKNTLNKAEMEEATKQIAEARVNPAARKDHRQNGRVSIDADDEPGPSRRAASVPKKTTTKRGKKTGKKAAVSSSDEEEDQEAEKAGGDATMRSEEEDDEDEIFVKTQKKTRKQPRRASSVTSQKSQPRKKSKEDEDEEEEMNEEEL